MGNESLVMAVNLEMLPLIDPIPADLLESELGPKALLRESNKGQNSLYVVNAADAPHVMQEIGRLRELSYRAEGGGTGKDCDIDDYDLIPNGYEQMLVWDHEQRQIMAAYRFVECRKIGPDSEGNYRLSSGTLFDFSKAFKEKILPSTIELGRAFVVPDYQPGGLHRKGIFALDNLWDGLGALTVTRPNIRFLYGKVTLFKGYPESARALLHSFLQHYFTNSEQWVRAKPEWAIPLPISSELQALWIDLDYEKALQILLQKSQEMGAKVPPLFPAYMSLSTTMNFFGFAHNQGFGQVDEAGILVTIADINQAKTERHILSYQPFAASQA